MQEVDGDHLWLSDIPCVLKINLICTYVNHILCSISITGIKLSFRGISCTLLPLQIVNKFRPLLRCASFPTLYSWNLLSNSSCIHENNNHENSDEIVGFVFNWLMCIRIIPEFFICRMIFYHILSQFLNKPFLEPQNLIDIVQFG